MLGPKLRFLHRDPKWWHDCDIVNAFLDKHVEEALHRREKGETASQLRLIDEMASATQDRLTLRFQMQNVFTPAHDGAAVTLSNAFFHLSRNPASWAKLKAEVMPTKNVAITYDLLKTYQYLKKCDTRNTPSYANLNINFSAMYQGSCSTKRWWERRESASSCSKWRRGGNEFLLYSSRQGLLGR